MATLLDLRGPVDWDGRSEMPSWLASELRGVQANVLRPHGRAACALVLLSVLDAGEATGELKALAVGLTSAASQLDEARHRRDEAGEGGGRRPTVRSLALSASGYRRLGLEPRFWPEGLGGVFAEGMAGRGAVLGDPHRSSCDAPYRHGVDVLLAIADDDPRQVDLQLQGLFGTRPARGLAVVGVERGGLIRNELGESVEHFGYVDGRSQPQFISGAAEADEARNSLGDWSARAAPDHVLVADPASSGSYGSFLVLRKLEQDVRAFHATAAELAHALELPPEEAARAGGLLFGRLPDGRPVHLADRLPSAIPVENGFGHGTGAGVCPVGAHIRLANSRSRGYPDRLMARRGMPYGARTRPPHVPQAPDEYPEGGVGLLFMAFMADIESQFEAIQLAANGAGPDGLVDPIIGQPPDAGYPRLQPWTDPHNGRQAYAACGGHVTLRGGGYFFQPSLDLFDALPWLGAQGRPGR